MRKILLLTLALLAAAAAPATQAATVTVRAPAATVTLTASKPAVIFGGDVELSGSISSRQSGQTVTLLVQPMGDQVTRVQVTTGAEGVWRYAASPRIQTAYTAKFRNASSAAVTINVRPRITLRKTGTTRYSVTVAAARSLAGKTAYVARWSASKARWILVRRFVLVQSRTSATSAVATVRFSVARRTKLRAFMSAAQAQPGYTSGYSNIAQADRGEGER